MPYTYVRNSPVAYNDPLGLYRINHTRKIVNDAIGAYTALPTVVNPTFECHQSCLFGGYRLQVVLDVRSTIHMPPVKAKGVKYYCDLMAELNHVEIFDNAIHGWMSTVRPWESKTYSSESECKSAGQAAMAGLKSANTYWSLLHNVQQLYEEARHNVWNWCPAPGTP